jgi:hypothetical protein
MDKWKDLYSQINAANPNLLHGSTPPKDKTYVSPRLQVLYKPNGDDSVTYKFGYGRFVANVIDNVTGYSRALSDNANGINRSNIYNGAALAASGASGSATVANFSAGSTLTTVNGHAVVLPADLTPYNYTHNVNGLRDYFANTVNGWLSQASFTTAGKQLMASDFQYPTTDTVNLGATWKIGEHQSLDIQYIFSRTTHASVQFTTDGSNIYTWSPNAQGLTYTPNANAQRDTRDQGDTVFMSNQTSRTNQIQVKWAYTSAKFSALFNIVAKDIRSSSGGVSRAFDQNGSADFYGAGAQYVWKPNAERRAVGTESFSGSFALNYNFDFGTKMGMLGTWHSGKFYDIYQGYNPDGDANGNPIWMAGSNLAHPNPVVGTGIGDWAMDLGLRISHPFKIGGKVMLEPFLQISNLLNNYDYGSNYTNTLASVKTLTGAPVYAGTTVVPRAPVANTAFGKRGLNYQVNTPRTAAFGFSCKF